MENSQMGLFGWWDEADFIVRGVFLLLILQSVIAWTIMLFKSWQFSVCFSKERRYGGRGQPEVETPSAFIFVGLSEATEKTQRENLAGVLIKEARLQMESGLTLLATIGNTAPFIGLFGTVWGIMHALQGLSGADALSMDLVAGPVAEALVATAAGLLTAIPAVMGYNLLLRKLRRLFGTVETNTVRILNGG